MKDILDEGGDFYNLHKLVFHDLDPEMHLGAGLTWYPPRSPQEGTVWTTVQSSQKIDDGCFLRNMPVAYCCIHDALESWSKSGSCNVAMSTLQLWGTGQD